jgi:3-oxoacyl-[acyl-carrier-protein] synthase II
VLLLQVRGYGLSGDGHHITAPHPQGLGAAAAMRGALRGSGVQPHHISYINAHATSTPIGDEIEQQAILEVFGPSDSSTSSTTKASSHNSSSTVMAREGLEGLAVSSTKGATGHLLGAAGAVEAAFTVLALYHGVAPPTCNLEQPEPQLLPMLVGAGKGVRLEGAASGALCNSFGFGGTNASLLFTTAPSQG